MYKYLIAFLLATSPALATDFTIQLTQLNGQPFTDEKGTPHPTTLSDVVTNSLMTSFPDEQKDCLEGKVAIDDCNKEKARRYGLAKKVMDKTDVQLTSDEITLIKKLVGKTYPALVMGQVWEILDPASIK